MSVQDEVTGCIIGAGVIGLALAAEISKPQYQQHHLKHNLSGQWLILDAENSFGTQISSRNSEVIHAGIYYPKNSLKARFCVKGKELLYQYCQDRHIPHHKTGKIIVATNDTEIPKLQRLQHYAKENGVHDLQCLSSKDLTQLEPALTGVQGLLSPSTGIIDSHQYMLALLAQAEKQGVYFIPNTKVLNINHHKNAFVINTQDSGQPTTSSHQFSIKTKYLINAAGLSAQNLAQEISPLNPFYKIPKLYLCKGHYASFQGPSIFSRLIYPLPTASGLGIHATLDLQGRLKFGPDSLYIDRQNYDLSSFDIDTFFQAIRSYFPTVQKDQLQPDYSGIRPKLTSPSESFADFTIHTQREHGIKHLVHLFGIESPGLTASLALAEYVTQALIHST